MMDVVGVLAENMIGSSKVEDVSLVLSNSDVMLDFINEIASAAKHVAIDNNELLKNTPWSWFRLNSYPGMVYAPEYDVGHNIIIEIPIDMIATGEEALSYIVTPKTFGLICTMIATVSILAQLKERRERDSGSDKKILGLMKRKLECNIDFFVEFYANLDSSLNKIRDSINSKNSESIDSKPASSDFNIISLSVRTYSHLRMVETRV